MCILPSRQCLAYYPIENIALVVPETEGSQSAVLYGFLQHAIRRQADVSISLKYFSGRGGSYAWNFLTSAPDNGYTLAALHVPSVMLLGADKDRVFSPDDIAPVLLFAYAANALWVAEDSPVRSLDDLVIHSRTPGNSLVIAGTGRYTDQHMADMLFNREAGVKSQYLPLTGTAESAEAVRQKRAIACWGYALARSSMPGLRPLAVAAEERCPILPDTPTFREEKMDVVGGQYFGLAAPATTKSTVLEEISALFLRLLADQDFRDEAAVVGFVLEVPTREDMPAFMDRQRLELERFLTDYPMFPKGTLPLWNPFGNKQKAPD